MGNSWLLERVIDYKVLNGIWPSQLQLTGVLYPPKVQYTLVSISHLGECGGAGRGVSKWQGPYQLFGACTSSYNQRVKILCQLYGQQHSPNQHLPPLSTMELLSDYTTQSSRRGTIDDATHKWSASHDVGRNCLPCSLAQELDTNKGACGRHNHL